MAVKEADNVSMADTAHALSRYPALNSLFLMQPGPYFNNAAMLATLPATLVDLTLGVYATVKVLQRWSSGRARV